MAAKPRAWLSTMAYAIAAVIIVLDQITKHWILGVLHMGPGSSIQVLPFFHLTMVWNPGVSFGLLQSPEGKEWIRWVLAVFSGIVAIALAVWVRKAHRVLPAVAIGLIIGGALGNLSDRIRWGQVVDFLDFSPIFPWVFNIADSGITVGVILLLLDSFLTGEKKPTADNQAPI